MSVDSVDSNLGSGVIELFGPEALLRHRRLLHAKMGEISMRLVEASHDQIVCIEEIARTNQALRDAGVDTDALAIELLSVVDPRSAMGGYKTES